MSEEKNENAYSNSENSDTDLDQCRFAKEKKDIVQDDYHRKTFLITDESCESISEDDSLGLLSEEFIETEWFEESENYEVIENLQNISINKRKTDEELDVSPICEVGRPYNIDLSTLQSTPKVKLTEQKITVIHEEEILIRSFKVSSKHDSAINLETVEISEHNLNVTHYIEKHQNDDSLNKTFETLNILNKTLPLVVSSVETHSNLNVAENLEGIKNKTFTESPEESKTVSSESLSPVISRCKKKKYRKEMRNSSSLITIDDSSESREDSTESLYPQSSISETDFTQSGTKKKTFKIDKGGQRFKKNTSPKNDTKKIETVRNEPRRILSNTNRDLKTSCSLAIDKNSSMNSGIPPKIIPHKIPTSSRNFPTKKTLPKAPLNLSFKKVSQEEISEEGKKKIRYNEILLKNEDYFRKKYQETSKLTNHPDYKLSLQKSMKEIARAKSMGESLKIPTIRLVEEPFIPETRNSSCMEKPPTSSRPGLRSYGRVIGRSRAISQTRTIPHQIAGSAIGPSRDDFRTQEIPGVEVEHLYPLPAEKPQECRVIGRSRAISQTRTIPHQIAGRAIAPVRGHSQQMPDHRMPSGRGYSRIPRPQGRFSSPKKNVRFPPK